MVELIKILYLEDQEEMIAGMEPFYDDSEFQVQFSSYENFDQLKNLIIEFCPQAIISDDDIGGKTYAKEIFEAVDAARRAKKKKIVLVGCSAFVNAKGMEPDYKRIGFDRFFDNDGSWKDLEEISKYIRKAINLQP